MSQKRVGDWKARVFFLQAFENGKRFLALVALFAGKGTLAKNERQVRVSGLEEGDDQEFLRLNDSEDSKHSGCRKNSRRRISSVGWTQIGWGP